MKNKNKPKYSKSPSSFHQNRNLILSLIITLLSIGCTQVRSVPRDRLVENLGPIVRIESRSTELTLLYQRLKLIGWINDEDTKKLKEYYDVYYIYHKGAVVSLAQGDVETCKSLVHLAEEELKSIEAKLKSLLVNIKAD